LQGTTQSFSAITTCIGDASSGDIWFLSDQTLTFMIYDQGTSTFSGAYISDGSALSSITSTTDLQIQSNILFLLF